MTKHKPQHHLNYAQPERCGGKNRYPSKQQAEAVKEEQELLQPGLELKVYRCQAGCSGWHLSRVKQDQ